MKILIVTNLFPNPFQPQRGTFNRDQVQALSVKHEVEVICPIAWTDEFTARRNGLPKLPKSRRMMWDGVSIEYPRLWFVPRTLRGFYGRCFQWSVASTFRRVVGEFRPDIVFATWAYPDGWATIRLARKAGLPVVLKVHGSDILELGRHPSRRRGTVAALRNADRVVAVSRDLADNVRKLGADPAKVHLIYNGVDPKVFHPGDRTEARRRLGLDPTKPILLYVGNLLPVKGPDILLDACALLFKRNVEYELHVLGRGPLRPTLERRAATFGIGDRIRFHGSIPHDQLPDWFRSASILVLPSRSEGVPNVLLEASACGTPFVASRVGGVPEVAHLGVGRLFSVGETTQLADAIVETLESQPHRSSCIQTARSHADVANDLVQMFEMAHR